MMPMSSSVTNLKESSSDESDNGGDSGSDRRISRNSTRSNAFDFTRSNAFAFTRPNAFDFPSNRENFSLGPSMLDGLNPCQRKVLYSSFKKKFFQEATVSHFAWYVIGHSACHNGIHSLQKIIISMAQDYVGSNNVNLLKPRGQFGTRRLCGIYRPNADHLYTQLATVTRSLFHVDDDILLNYLIEDGRKVEPAWYLPIIPMVLVNGCSKTRKGGRSTFVPKYNPRDIIKNVRRFLNDEPMEAMHPWYRGFEGKIEETVTEVGVGTTYTISGIIEPVNDTTLRITELPIKKSTVTYLAYLFSVSENGMSKDQFIKSFRDYSGVEKVDIIVNMSSEQLSNAKKVGFLKYFNLTTRISTTNMHLLDAKGAIKKYATPLEIMDEFCPLRLELYETRKRVMLKNKEIELSKCDNIIRIIEWYLYLDGEKTVREKDGLRFTDLEALGFDPFPTVKNAATDDAKETEDDGYGYLRSLTVRSVTQENCKQLKDQMDMLKQELENLKNSTAKSLWIKDLEELEEVLAKDEIEYEREREVFRRKPMKVSDKVGESQEPRGC